MATEINVPVKLQIQNLQQLITDLQSKLSNLKVGSTGFKSIQNTINAIRGEIDKLSIQTSKPFIDAGQFTKAEHSVDKLEEQIDKVSLTISRLKFSDLELTSEQKADIKAFEDQINSIKDKLKVVKNTAKDEFLNSELGQQWLKIDDTAFSKSLSQITNNIRHAVAEQNASLNELQQTALSYQRAIEESSRIRAFFDKNGNNPLGDSGSSIATLGQEMYDKIFTTTQAGKWQFKSGGKNLLAQWLESELKLDESTISAIINKNVSANQVGAKLKEVLNTQLQLNQKTVDNNPNITADIEKAEAKYDELIAILRQVGLSEEQVAASEQVLRAALSNVSGEAQAYKDKLVEAVRSNEEVKNTSTAMKSQLDSLRNTLQQTNGEFIRMQRTQQSFNQMKMAVVNFMGFNQVLNLTKNAIREAINHIRELDSVMNKISIVTDMSTSDLWDQVDAYSKMAQAYGVSIKGAYEVSQIYYQQGLQTADVLTLTNETLKLAKISGLDYATTTDYMTTALRGFKMEMSEASRVVDVYSNLASHTAVSQEELAVAMSKTASSMEAVGATFEEASAMIGTMVAVTRESATNIGSAMKSIASRYGELTKDPTKLVDEEGEAMAFNKVDAALQSVGISMRTVDGQFREFTDVIIELGEKWDQLDSVQQRYIATQFAGNRQQSRFLALVSNVDLLKSNLNYAENSEDTGTLQALKALDSIESKTEQVRVAYQQFYTTIGAENVWKGFLDSATNVINTLNSFPKLFGKLPVSAIAAVASIINVIKSLGVKLISGIAEVFGPAFISGLRATQNTAESGAESIFTTILNTIKGKVGLAKEAGVETGKAYIQGATEGAQKQKTEVQTIKPSDLTGNKKIKYFNNQTTIDYFKNNSQFSSMDAADIASSYEILGFNMQRLGHISSEVWTQIKNDPNGVEQGLKNYINSLQTEQQELLKLGNTAQSSGNKIRTFAENHKGWSKGLQSFGSALNMAALMIDTSKPGMKTLSGTLMSISGAATLAGIAIQALNSGIKSIPIMAVVSGVFALINGISTLIITPEEKLKELEDRAEDLNNKAKEAKANYRTLDNSIKKIDELKEKRYESAEAAEEYQSAIDELASKFPQLIGGFDAAGNIILNVTNAENVLAEARKKSQQATYDAAEAELETSKNRLKQSKEKVQEIFDKMGGGAGKVFSGTTEASQNTIDTFANFANKYYYGFDREDIDSQTIDSQIGAMIKDIAIGSQDQTLWKEYLPTITDKNGLYNFSLSSYGNFLSQQEELSSLATDILNLINTLYGNEKQTSNIAEIDEAINKFNASTGTDEIIENYNNLMKLLNQLFSTEEGKQVGAQYLTIYDQLQDLSKEIDNTVTENTLYTSFKKQVISAWQQSVHANVDAWEYLKQSSNAAGMVTDFINKTIENDYDGDYSKAKEAEESNWRRYQSTMSTFLSSLSDERLALFNSMTDDTANYSAEDIIKEFNITDISDSQDDLYDIIINYYKSGIDSIRERLTNNLASVSGKNLQYDNNTQNITGDQLTGFYENYQKLILQSSTKVQEEYLNNILKQYDSLKDAGFVNHAEEFGSASISLFTEISAAPAEIEKSLWTLINENGLTTLEGIQTIKDSIKNNSSLQGYISKDTLDSLYNNIIPNINLTIQTATSNLLDTLGDTSKEVSKAISSGLELEEADQLITKAESLGLKLNIGSDFVQNGDKLVLTSEAFNNYWAVLNEKTNTQATQLQNNINLAMAALEKGEQTYLNENDKAAIQAIAPNFDFSKYLNDYGSLTNEGIIELSNAIGMSQESLKRYLEYNRIAAESVKNAFDWSLGDYSSYSNDLFKLKELASGKIELKKDDYNAKSIKNNINNAYDTLISDVLSKGFDNINLADYEGLIALDESALNAAIQQGDYQSFVRQYAEFAGKTIDETNDLLLQAIEKQREQTSEDLIKDFTFLSDKQFRADHTQLGKLANAFDKPLSDLLNSAAVIFDETTQEYVVNIEKLKDQGIDLTAVDNFKLTVQESVDSMFNALASEIKNALGGSLDAKGVKTLTDDLQKMGINASLHFTKTKDGYKLAVDEVQKLYDELKSVDALTAQIVLDELNKSIEDSVTNTKKLKGEIAELRATTESDDFKFMDKDIPSGQNNPLNYFNNWYKAFQAWDAAGKGRGQDKGKIAYEDFYNIITEMGNLAETSNQVIPIGNQFVSNAQDAAALIQKGAAALSVASDGTLKVDLGKLGVDFSAGSEDLKKNVTEGIKSIAQSEIDMLDSMIQLLETIVAMEDLGNLAGEGGDKETIEIEDILPDIEFDDKGNATKIGNFSKSYDEWIKKIKDQIDEKSKNYNEDLAKAVKNIKIDDISFEEILGLSPEKLAGKGKDFLDKYAAVMDAFWKAAKSDNYDLNNIWASVKEVLAGSNKNYVGDIDIGDMHLTFTNGVVLERVDGGYKVGDKVYKDANKATEATYAADVKAMEDAARTYNENGSVTYKGALTYTVSYNLTSKTYTVDFGEGNTATSTTKEGIELAIATYAQIKETEINPETDTKTEGVTFTLNQSGKIAVNVTLQDGEVTTDEKNGDTSIKDAAQAAVNKKAEEAAKAAEGITGDATITGGLNLTVGDGEITLDLSGKTIIPKGLPESIEISAPGPKLLYPSGSTIIDVTELKGEGTGTLLLSNCTLEYNEDSTTATVMNGEQALAEIPVTNLTGVGEGTLSAGNCEFKYDALNGTATITLLDGTIITIPSEQLNGIGTLQAGNCSISLDNNILTLSSINEDGTTSAIEVTLDNLSGVGTLDSKGCHITFNSTGLTIETQEGTTYTVNIPSDQLEGIATLLGATVTWSDKGENLIPDITLPESIYLGETSGKIKVTASYELDEREQEIQDFRNTLYGKTQRDVYNWLKEKGISDERSWQNSDYIKKDSTLDSYLKSLESAINMGKQLSKVDTSNIQKILGGSNQQWLDSETEDRLNNILSKNNILTQDMASQAANLQTLTQLDTSNLDGLAATLETIYTNIQNLDNFDWAGLAAKINLLNVPTPEVPTPSLDEPQNIESGTTTILIEGDPSAFNTKASEAKEAVENNPPTMDINGEDHATEVGEEAVSTIDAMTAAITISATNSASSVINSIKSALNNLVSGGPYNVTVNASVKTSGNSPARGTIGLAQAGGTLMGELGPELVVSSGRYFVVGQNGPEMVNLADDAIVFNHLQTKSLLEKGTSPTRGKAITNERIAASYAKGNIDGGPAMASASAALAALKQLRAQWQALLGMSAKDLAGKGGGGGGGGSSTDPKAFTTELEKWYNWLQKIDELEKDINRYEAERNRNASSWNKNGKLYYNSQMQSLEALKQQVDITADLVNSQTEYFNLRRAELNSSKNPYSTLYTFDEYGQLRYKDGRLEEMSKLVGRNEYGKANMTAEQQYKELIKLVPSQYLDYDSSGNKIDKSKDDWYVTAVESFWNRIDADKEEMQGLFDSINDNTIKINNLQEEQNKLLEEMRDNQMEVEDMIMDSLVEMRQRVIDNMSKERERLQDSSEKYLSGLSDALNKEKDMYQDQQNEEETRKLQRQLAILRRSGGSGAEIRNLEEQLRNRQQDAYFEQQQKQIDAIQEASDKELERLETQITIAQETLDYQKEMGLLWQEVYEIMAGTPEAIASFIESNNPERWGESNLRSETDYRDTLFKAEQWAAYRDDTRTHEEQAMPQLKSIATGDEEKRIQAEVDAKLKEQNEKNASTTTTTTTTTNNNNNNNNNNKAQKKEDNKQWHATATAAFYNEKGLQSYQATAAHKNKSMAESNAMYYAKRKGHGSFYSPGSGVKSSYYKKGGIIDYTGLAWVDGSKGNPEGILNAEQMDLLRNEILGTKNNSLVNLLLDFKNTYDTLGSNYISSINNSGITIENATVEMHVDQISNDYDARRAGEQALSEIMRIARKTSAKNSVGR